MGRGQSWRRQTPESFWSKVVKGEGCWERPGHSDRGGYRPVKWGQRRILAHRLAWELTHGPIPPGMRVLHKCDNPPCVNPTHLFIGTQRDNIADMVAKGRARGKSQDGEANHFAKLTAQDVLAIRSEAATGRPRAQIAAEHGVSYQTVWDIERRRTWQSLADFTEIHGRPDR